MVLCSPEMVGALALFRDLNAKQLAWVSERMRCKTFPAGANLITADQPGEAVYFILNGTIKIHIEQLDGRDVILAILGRGDTVGEMSLIDSAGHSASAVTLEETELMWIDRSTFQECLQNIPPFAISLVRILSARVRLANELIQALATLDVYGRVARQLLAFADKYGEASAAGEVYIPIQLTQGDIADLVGASRKRVNQVMVSFKQLGLISTGADGHITVHQRAKLARYCK
jgi:CRP/FNR family transcriptional regulator, cyclic AMP receptor protein